MKKIVSVIRPFLMKQNIFVYENGNKIDVTSAPLNAIETVLVETAKKYDVKTIELVGPKSYSAGIKLRVEGAEMDKYNKNDIEVKIING